LTKKGYRKRQKWTAEEDKILIEGHQKYVNGSSQIWGKICVQLCNRRNIDCKDRWRVLLKKHQTKEAIYELLKSM
jgi:hypothetical protein